MLRSGPVLWMFREPQLGAFELVVDLTVLVFTGEPGAHAEAVVRCDGDVAPVEQAVEVGTKEEAVRDVVRTTGGIRNDVGSLQGGERVLARDGALLVGALDGKPERALAEPGTDRPLGPVAGALVLGEQGALFSPGWLPDEREARAEAGGVVEASLPDPPSPLAMS